MSARAAVLVTSSASLPAVRFPSVRPAQGLPDRRWSMLTLLWAMLVVTPDLALRAPAFDVACCVRLLASWLLWGAVAGGLSALRLPARARAVASGIGALALLPTVAVAFGCLALRWQPAPALDPAALAGSWAVQWNGTVAPMACAAAAAVGLALNVLSRSGQAADDRASGPWSPSWTWARGWSWTSTLVTIPLATATVATVQYYLRPWF
jgi:hypothetical protein